MSEPKLAAYGSWRSPVTSDLIVSESIRLGQAALQGHDTYWIEGRPAEAGRNVIVKRDAAGVVTDLIPQPFNARTRVHEYGGGDYVVDGSTIYFSNFTDQRLYRVTPNAEPQPITPAANRRYADAIVDRQRNRLICVCEDHTNAEREAVNMLVGLPLNDSENIHILVAGNDFYASPRLSPDGSQLAWLTWHHPNMPWDGCELWVGTLGPDGHVGRAELVAGGPEESIFQPQWSPDGVLYFISDRSGWWNIYRLHKGQVEPLYPLEAEFGVPQWIFGLSTYAFASPERIICCYSSKDGSHLAFLDTTKGQLTPLETPYTSIGGIQANAERVVFIGASPTDFPAVIELDLATRKTTVLRRSGNVTLDPAYISVPQPIEFPTEHALTAYGYYYAPHNADYQAPADELPPLLVISHGGPTSATSSALSLSVQFWTSRGFAVLDVDYGGSSGYGRAYRERLKGQWGIVDVDDCVNGARYLVEQGLVDGKRLAIRGGSAGGYTTLCALTFRDTFSAGASHFGVSDLAGLAQDTHKFESRYLFSLVGPYPERQDLYYQRSPINFANRISCPVIFFQGVEDKIVPPEQAESMVTALRANKVPVAYLLFEGEQHGFRRAENIKRTLEAELYFYARVFHFEPADRIEPVIIENI
jgi:dipeptidyl aminopeptidase/acylaminoacyl peptidase